MIQVTSLVAERLEPFMTGHLTKAEGTSAFLKFGGDHEIRMSLTNMPDGDKIVWLRRAAEECSRLADLIDGRVLAEQARGQAERDAYDADLADLRSASPVHARQGGDCS